MSETTKSIKDQIDRAWDKHGNNYEFMPRREKLELLLSIFCKKIDEQKNEIEKLKGRITGMKTYIPKEGKEKYLFMIFENNEKISDIEEEKYNLSKNELNVTTREVIFQKDQKIELLMHENKKLRKFIDDEIECEESEE